MMVFDRSRLLPTQLQCGVLAQSCAVVPSTLLSHASGEEQKRNQQQTANYSTHECQHCGWTKQAVKNITAPDSRQPAHVPMKTGSTILLVLMTVRTCVHPGLARHIRYYWGNEQSRTESRTEPYLTADGRVTSAGPRLPRAATPSTISDGITTPEGGVPVAAVGSACLCPGVWGRTHKRLARYRSLCSSCSHSGPG